MPRPCSRRSQRRTPPRRRSPVAGTPSSGPMSKTDLAETLAPMADPGTPGPAAASRGATRSAFRLDGIGRYVGVAPFLLFAILFLIVPTLNLAASAFYDTKGNLTLQNIVDLGRPQIIAAYW